MYDQKNTPYGGPAEEKNTPYGAINPANRRFLRDLWHKTPEKIPPMGVFLRKKYPLWSRFGRLFSHKSSNNAPKCHKSSRKQDISDNYLWYTITNLSSNIPKKTHLLLYLPQKHQYFCKNQVFYAKLGPKQRNIAENSRHRITNKSSKIIYFRQKTPNFEVFSLKLCQKQLILAKKQPKTAHFRQKFMGVIQDFSSIFAQNTLILGKNRQI